MTTTDYVTLGTAYIMQFDGTIIDSFSVGVSPGNMALDVRKTTSTENLSKPLSVKVYPNPTFSTIILDFYTDIQLYKLYLTDMLGKVIYKKDVRDVRKTQIIDINDYSQGIYFLIIETNQRKSIYKIVKY
ncbi:MAG: T9SS type A sorting domain-containing protein [Bacteroidetes bacterium]|nr:T9SS type A sorting domain-containing protein [Bacteroidota bacterium]